MTVFLFLRFLLGSNNHMWLEFVYPDRDEDHRMKANPGHVVKDFLFLLVFGLIGMEICYAATLSEFLFRNEILLGTALCWGLVFTLVQRKKGRWSYWVAVNLVQLVFVIVVRYVLLPLDVRSVPLLGWSWSVLVLFLAYLGIFVWDFWQQLEILGKEPLPLKTPPK